MKGELIQRREARKAFVEKHKRAIADFMSKDSGYGRKGWKQVAGLKQFVHVFTRSELDYGSTTNWEDIWWTIRRTYEEMYPEKGNRHPHSQQGKKDYLSSAYGPSNTEAYANACVENDASPQKVLRWVKASERLPTEHKEYPFWDMTVGRYGISYYFGNGRSIIEGRPDRILWLEEAEAPAAQPDKQDDIIPDLSTLSDAEKQEFVQGFIKTTAEAFLKVFVMLGMRDGIESGVINDATGDFFVISFKRQQPTETRAQQGEVPEEVIGKLWEKNMAGHPTGINPHAFRLGAIAMYHRCQEQIRQALQTAVNKL